MRVFVIMIVCVCVSGAVSDTGEERGMRAASSLSIVSRHGVRTYERRKARRAATCSLTSLDLRSTIIYLVGDTVVAVYLFIYIILISTELYDIYFVLDP